MDWLRLKGILVQITIDTDTANLLATGLNIPKRSYGEPVSTGKHTHFMTGAVQRLCDLRATQLVTPFIIRRVKVGDDQNFHKSFKPVSILCLGECSYSAFNGALPREPLLGQFKRALA